MGIARSTYYYKGSQEEDKILIANIEAIAIEYPRYGYRRITKELHRRGTHVNHKVVLKLMRRYQLTVKHEKKFVVHTTDSNHPYPIYPNLIQDLVVTRLNQV